MAEIRDFKTRPQIIEAFIVLLEEKPLDKISVKELCEAAGISRKTFYVHYNYVSDVANELQAEMVESIESFLDTIIIGEYGLGPQYFFHFINALYSSNPRFFENLVSATNYHFFIQGCTKALKAKLLESMNLPEERKAFVSLQVDFCLGGASSIYVEWLKNGKPVPFEEVTGQIASIIMGALS